LFNSRPVDKREPYDFAVAVELMASRMGVKPMTAQDPGKSKIERQEREIKKLQQKHALEGGGRGVPNVAPNSQRHKDLQAGIEKGDLKEYFAKHYIKSSEGTT